MTIPLTAGDSNSGADLGNEPKSGVMIALLSRGPGRLERQPSSKEASKQRRECSWI
jgi:hypothetical protein